MAKLPTDLSGREVRTALERAGFVFADRAAATWSFIATSRLRESSFLTTNRSGPEHSAASLPTPISRQFLALLG